MQQPNILALQDLQKSMIYRITPFVNVKIIANFVNIFLNFRYTRMNNVFAYILVIIVICLPFYFVWRLVSRTLKRISHSPSESKPKEQQTSRVTIVELQQNNEHTASYSIKPSRIRLHNLKFKPLHNQIIYVESDYDTEVNTFIRNNYDDICQHFRLYGYEFCYLPYLSTNMEISRVCYYAPYLNHGQAKSISSQSLLSTMPEDMRKGIVPSLLYYSSDFYSHNEESGGELFGIIAIDLCEIKDTTFATILKAIINDINKNRQQPRYSLSDNHSIFDSFMSSNPDQETLDLINEIETRVARLVEKGVSKHILEQIVAKPEVVSRMVITRDNSIILTDYNNMEIVMTPLVKAVYFLFLRHPEGIVFKHLADYREELIDIYKDIKGTPPDSKMIQSIIDITNPTKNSINEKVARIREAFVTRFDEHLAVNYIIHGERGGLKRIPLHREFITWQ